MSVASLTSVQLGIIRLVKKFKFEELESTVIPTFPETSWSNIRSELVKQHKRFTSANVAQCIKVIITKARLKKNDLADRLATLELLDICWHSNRRIWYGYTLTDAIKPPSHLIIKKLQQNIKDHLNSVDMQVSVKANSHNGIIYVSIKEERIRKGQRQVNRPFFFALFIRQNYFFSAEKYALRHVLNAIVNTLGYKNSKRFKLIGRDLVSLSALCWKKREGAMNSENVHKILKYKDMAVDEKETGIDFTQQKARKKYGEKCFGDDPPTLELLVINAPSVPVSHSDVSAELAAENLQITWEFRSRNIAEYLTKLIERRILVTPVPDYISNVYTLGRNELTLKVH